MPHRPFTSLTGRIVPLVINDERLALARGHMVLDDRVDPEVHFNSESMDRHVLPRAVTEGLDIVLHLSR